MNYAKQLEHMAEMAYPYNNDYNSHAQEAIDKTRKDSLRDAFIKGCNRIGYWVLCEERMPPKTFDMDMWVYDGKKEKVVEAYLIGDYFHMCEGSRINKNITHWYEILPPQPPAFKIKHSMKYQLLLISAATIYAQQYNGDPTATEAWAKQVTGNEHPGLEFEDTDSVNVTIDGEKVNITKDSDYLTWNGTAWGKMTAEELAAEHTITGQAKWTLMEPAQAS